MDVPWRRVKAPSYVSAEKPAPLTVFEIEKVTEGLFAAARRIYMITNDDLRNEKRGGHRHPTGGKLEFLICTRGAMIVELHYPGHCDLVVLDTPHEALVISSDVWHEITLGPDSQLLSVATTNFDPHEALTDKLCGC